MIGLYMDGTPGAKDGVLLEEFGRIVTEVDVAEGITKTYTLAVRTDEGYVTKGGTVINLSGVDADKLRLSVDGVEWFDTIVIEGVADTNKTFYLQVHVEAGSELTVDTINSLRLQATIKKATE